jgi:hypothetical protein
MTTASLNLNSSALEQILANVRNINCTIGNYQNHSILQDEHTYKITLTNGIISVYKEELCDIQLLPEERFRDIAARFREKVQFLS